VERTDSLRQWNFEFPDGADPHASFVIRRIGDIKWSLSEALFGGALVSVADLYCLDCGELEWIDSFAHDTMRGGYSIYRGEVVRGDQTLKGYFMRFFQYTGSNVRGLVEGGYSYATMYFWMPVSRFSEMEHTIMDIMRSFQFVKAARDCWGTKPGG